MKNVEKDYLDVAINPITDKLLAEHWKKVAETKIWVKSTGEEIPFKDLSNEHIGHILQMLIRFDTDRVKPALEAITSEIYGRFVSESKVNDTGDCNTGDWNTGNWNTGNRNTGNCNTGNCNTGDWNACDFSNGFFNTKEPTVNIFNVDSGMTAKEFRASNYHIALTSASLILTEWIYYTDEEKKSDKKKELIGGYLKKYTYQEACANWWGKLSSEAKEIIKQIPNFSADIFKEITGIDVNE